MYFEDFEVFGSGLRTAQDFVKHFLLNLKGLVIQEESRPNSISTK